MNDTIHLFGPSGCRAMLGSEWKNRLRVSFVLSGTEVFVSPQPESFKLLFQTADAFIQRVFEH